MKTISSLLFLALAAPAFADLPKPAPNTRYAQLWTDSPFTAKPPPDQGPIEVNPLEDYALAGVSPIPGGHRVTIINKKNPEERIYIPDPAKPEFKILAIQYSANPMGTTVRLAAGSKTGTVSVDEKLLVLKAAPAPQPQQQQNMPPGTVPQPPVPGQPNAEAPRQPRPRVVPPAPNGAPQTTPQPQVNPQQQIQQQQQQRQQRLNRR